MYTFFWNYVAYKENASERNMELQVEMLETSRYYCQTDIAKTQIAR